MGALSALRHTYAENEGPHEDSLEIALCVHLIYADVRYDDESDLPVQIADLVERLVLKVFVIRVHCQPRPERECKLALHVPILRVMVCDGTNE